MFTINAISTYLSTHTFVHHEMGNYANYGLNMFGCDSIIDYNNDIWKFYAFQAGTDNAIYYNKNGTELILDSRNMPEGITRVKSVDF
jgi:hypothetical protein